MRLAFVAVLLAACHRHEEAPPSAKAGPPPPPPSVPAPAPAREPEPEPPLVQHHHYELRRDELVDGYYWKCSVVDTTTHQVVGRATGKNVAAGGTTIECTDFAADGKVIVFSNSRASLGKDARPGKTNDEGLPCSYAIYADDASSCVSLDVSPFLLSGAGDDATPFELRLSDIAGQKDKLLVSIPHGLARAPGPDGFPSRWWDARYCENDRLLVVAEGSLSLYEAPSGKRISKIPAPKQTKITDCHGTVAETASASGEKRTWTVRRDGIE
jgi:hypothetical protein